MAILTTGKFPLPIKDLVKVEGWYDGPQYEENRAITNITVELERLI